MIQKYEYPKPEGYLFNMQEKIRKKLKFKENEVYFVMDSDLLEWVFPRKLTVEEEDILEEIMTNNPTDPDLSGTVFVISDLYGMRNELIDKIGENFNLWFEGNEKEDIKIYMQFPKELSKEMKNKVINIYKSLIKEMK